jgi:lipoprotein-anchoring transpeptidase ErfK/SrfK
MAAFGGHRAGPVRALSLAARVGVVALVGVLALAGCTTTATGSGAPAAPSVTASPTPSGSVSVSASASTAPSSSTSPSVATQPVHVSSLESDNLTYGVGMPIVLFFNKQITDVKPFVQAVKVTVNGADAGGSWFIEKSGRAGEKLEAHYRPQAYWPGHSQIHVDLPLAGVSAGTGFAFQNSLTLDFSTGAAHVLTVDGATHLLTVMSDGKLYGTFPVSLGASKTPTLLGTKVISEKDRNERMVGSGYNEVVPWSMRITQSGEYLHAAAWNVNNIGHYNTSNGCTNLLPKDAQALWSFLSVGDPVSYTNTGGSAVAPVWDGYGDWNVSWATWQLGGALPTGA